jgi:hypothetical protein
MPATSALLRFAAWCLPVLFVAFPARGGDKPDDELARYDARIKPKDRQHWAFQPVRPVAVPAVHDTSWVRNSIDNFILAKLEAQGWKPSPVAEPRALLRRMYLDVIGLPPTLAEQEALLKDPSPAGFDRLADQLLSRSAYGERWARHWLDLVRYAETNGYERDGTKPHVWRYRDYVIRAFNEDKPYDQFIREQLAGDELALPSTPTGGNPWASAADALIATGYYRLGPWDDEPADPAEDRFDQLDDMVNTTSQVFLGLTLGCARCHNHKFEPLTALDYYRMVAIFNVLKRPQQGRAELDLSAGTREQVDRVLARDREIAKLRLGEVGTSLRSLGTAVLIEDQVRRLRQVTPDLPRGYFLREPSPKAPETHLLLRGQASKPGPRVEPGVPAVLVSAQPAFLPPDQHTSRRRLSLARWIASRDNPLTARVMVNRIWQFHFGEGLVRTPSDFGVMGEKPTHPELLDWLANWFVQEGWSIKKLHRLILTSNTYRMSKLSIAEYQEKDPENHLWWRFPYRRLEVEAIRDSMLAVSGRLNPKMYGPSMYPQVPKEALEGSSDPDTIWKASDEKEASRRTIYAHVKRSMIVPMLEVLDLCDTTRTSAKRNVTSVAPQALTLLNGEFTNRQARHFADRLRQEAGSKPEQQIDLAYRLALCRPPTDAERTRLVQFLKDESLEQMCRVILNLNEFVYSD